MTSAPAEGVLAAAKGTSGVAPHDFAVQWTGALLSYENWALPAARGAPGRRAEIPGLRLRPETAEGPGRLHRVRQRGHRRHRGAGSGGEGELALDPGQFLRGPVGGRGVLARQRPEAGSGVRGVAGQAVSGGAEALWLARPLAVLGDAPGGIVVRAGRIVELVPAGGTPSVPATAFDAGRHVVLPGLINTHHHFYQTLTRAFPAALDRDAVRLAADAVPGLGTADARRAGGRGDGGPGRAAALRLHHDHRPPLRVSRRAGGRDRHRGRRRRAARHARGADAGLDEPVATRWRAAAGQRGAGRGHDPGRQRAADRPPSRPGAARDAADRAGAVLAVQRDHRADAGDRQAGRHARRPPAHAPGRDGGRGGVLPGALRLLARSTTWSNAAGCGPAPGSRTASISAPATSPAWPRPVSASPIAPVQQPGPGLRHLPGLRAGARPGSAVGLGVDGSASNDVVEPDAGGACRLPAAARHLRRRGGEPSRRAALGDAGLGRLPRAGPSWGGSRWAPRRTWRCSRWTSCASPAPATRSPPSCCAARTQADRRDGRRAVGGRGRRHTGPGPAGADAPAPDGGGAARGGLKRPRATLARRPGAARRRPGQGK